MKKTDKSVDSLTKLATAIDRAYSDWPQLIWRSFASGLFTALGATIGLAVVVAILSFFFTQLSSIPVVGQPLSKINTYLTPSK